MRCTWGHPRASLPDASGCVRLYAVARADFHYELLPRQGVEGRSLTHDGRHRHAICRYQVKRVSDGQLYALKHINIEDVDPKEYEDLVSEIRQGLQSWERERVAGW